MDQRAAYLLQILETIGAPLMGAITSASPPDAQGEAQAMAALLGKTVEASIDLGNIMEINPAEAQDDTLRVALAGLAGPLVAGQFAKRGQVPDSAELKKITNALQAVLTFSDNFTPTPETVERLKNLKASGQSVDAYQTQIQYMQAFIPVTEVIAAFPFGQSETKLIMDVSDRLVKKSVELRETLLPNVGDEAVQKQAELALLRALASLYSACHKAETEKVLNVSEEARGAALSIAPVWTAFDLRAAMLEALAVKMVPMGSAGSSGGQAPAVAATVETPAQPPAAAQVPPVQAPPATPPPVVETPPQAAPPVTPPAQAESTPAAPPQGGNPMSMFAKPKGDGAQAVPPPAETPPPVTPPAAPPVQPPPVAPPPETPAATPPPAADQQSGASEEGGSQGGGGPMSFFKKEDE